MARPCLTGVIDYAWSKWEIHLRDETDIGAITHVPYSTEAKECLYFSVYNEVRGHTMLSCLHSPSPTFPVNPTRDLVLSAPSPRASVATNSPDE